MHPSTTAREVLALKKQQDTIREHYSEYLNNEIELSDLMVFITRVSPDPLSRALFRSLYSKATPVDLKTVRMAVNGHGRYGNDRQEKSGDSASDATDQMRRFKDQWLGPARDNKDLFLGEDAATKAVNWFATPHNRCPYSISEAVYTIKVMLTHGLKSMRMDQSIYAFPFHIRSMMLIRNQIKG